VLCLQGGENKTKKVTLHDVVHPAIKYSIILFNTVFSVIFFKLNFLVQNRKFENLRFQNETFHRSYENEIKTKVLFKKRKRNKNLNLM
jgi:hypothetical protein